MLKKIIITSVTIKLILFCVGLISETYITCKDESTNVYLSGSAHENVTLPLPAIDHVIRKVLSPFLKWDSQYFMGIAEYGYTHEKIYAFYPLYPLMIRYFSKCLQLIFF